MTEEIPDLWGEFSTVSVLTPKSILVKQASILRDRTDGKIMCKIFTGSIIKPAEIERIRRYYESDAPDGAKIYHSFSIIAPVLEGFSLLLFRIVQSPEIYPCYFRARYFQKETIICENSDELLAILGETLQSDKMKRVLSTVLAQVNDAEVDPAPF